MNQPIDPSKDKRSWYGYFRTTKVCATISPRRCRLAEVSVTTNATDTAPRRRSRGMFRLHS